MKYYFDTSAVCRYYHQELGSDVVDQICHQPDSTVIISWLTVLETYSAFAMKVRTGEIVQPQYLLLVKRLNADIASRRLIVARVLRRHFDLAATLISQHAMARKLRSLDALHVSIALDLASKGHVNVLVTADSAMIQTAVQEGLTIINPLAS